MELLDRKLRVHRRDHDPCPAGRLQMPPAPKRKASAPASASAKKAKKPGSSAAGRPTTAEALAKKAPAAGDEPVQRSVAAMFGARAAPTTPAAFVADLKRWEYYAVGSEEAVQRWQQRRRWQRQRQRR